MTAHFGPAICPRDVSHLPAKKLYMKVRRHKVRIVWTCSDFSHHEHWSKAAAWICGRIQGFRAWILREWI